MELPVVSPATRPSPGRFSPKGGDCLLGLKGAIPRSARTRNASSVTRRGFWGWGLASQRLHRKPAVTKASFLSKQNLPDQCPGQQMRLPWEFRRNLAFHSGRRA